MGRPVWAAPGDTVYHVLNRANGRMPLFEDDGDYLAFQRVLAQASDRVGMRLLAYCGSGAVRPPPGASHCIVADTSSQGLGGMCEH